MKTDAVKTQRTMKLLFVVEVVVVEVVVVVVAKLVVDDAFSRANEFNGGNDRVMTSKRVEASSPSKSRLSKLRTFIIRMEGYLKAIGQQLDK